MSNPLKTEAIRNFLMASTHPDLAALYNDCMEVQVIVGEDGGRRVDGDFKGKNWHGWSDGLTTWKHIRIPLGAATKPHWEDSPMTFDLAAHCMGVGMTGWDWKNQQSLWVGFDFDGITGHSDTHSKKLTDQQLKEVQAAACDIPWVTVRRSTSGNGLHLYVFIDPVTTTTHTEHAAVARAIMGMMAAKTGHDFHAKVDVMGYILWQWHRKMRGTQGLTLIKKGEILYDIPPNWRDHIEVIKGTRRKTMPLLIAESKIPEIENTFDDLTSQRANVPLDEEHRRLIDWLNEKEINAVWDQDRHMLVTHTFHLKQAHQELTLRGIFDTISTGRERGADQNCFLFPMRKGAWAVRRFTPGVGEHASWSQDGSGWTQCYYNREPDLATAAKTNEGIEHKTGGFVFSLAEQAVQAAALVGVEVKLEPWALTKPAKLKESKDGKLVMELDYDAKNDAARGGLKGWHPEGKTWSKVFNANLRPIGEVEVGNYDDVIRHLISSEGTDCGWTIRSDGVWVGEPLTHVKVGLQGALGLLPKEVTAIVGASVFRHWTLVNYPFQPEYPGDRKWNRGAAQFRYHPNENRDNLLYPTWLKLLSHCGRGLDDAVQQDGWCHASGIITGADYLKVWIASLFQFPLRPLPYLFLYSKEQNTGKSSLHEALFELVTHGVVRADVALTNQQGFNGELANAILCVVEEVDLSRSKVAYNRIKDFVTARQLAVHPKGETVYSIPNSTHWIQTANDHRYCPVFPGDTRITMIHVRPLELHELIPKDQFMAQLNKEASDFLAEVLTLEIPMSNDRLNVPVIVTSEKLNAQKSNLTRLEAFISEHCHNVTGRMIKFSEFVERFHEWLDAEDIHDWSKQKTGKELPPHFPKGRRPQDNQFYIGNISWTVRKPEDPILPKLELNDKELLVPVKGVE